MQGIKKNSLAVLRLGGGDHAAHAVLDLAECVYGDAKAGGDLGCRFAIKRVGAIGRHRTGIQHCSRKDMLYGSGVAGLPELHVHVRRRIGRLGKELHVIR